MSENKEKEKKLATNRLLDILRSQQPTELVEDDKSMKEEKTVIDEKEQSADIDERQPLEETKALGDTATITLEEEVSSGIKKEPSVTDEISDNDAESSIPGASKKKEISAGDLLSTLKSVQSDPLVSEEIKVSKVPKTEPKVDRPKPKVEKLSTIETKVQKTIRTGASNLLEQIQKPEEKPKPKELKELQPIEFDSSLLSTLSERKQKKTIQDYLQSLFHLFNESQRRVTIHRGEKNIRLLQIKTGFKKTEIEKAKAYTLPYKTKDGQIEDSFELIQYIFKNELDSKEVRYAYGAYFSPDVETKTHILQAPSLSKK